jgi:hypothetical protein
VRVLTPRLPAALALTALVVSIAGCSAEPAPPLASASAAPTTAPLFASDEEALAAAEAAFEEYLDVAFRVFADGGIDPGRLETVATDEVLATDISRAADFAARGLRQVGEPVVLETTLQQHTSDERGNIHITSYSCMEGRSVSAVDSDGNELGNPNRARTVTLENHFTGDPTGTLRLSKSTVWAAGESCGF